MDREMRSREIINDFMVNIFYQVLDIERFYMHKSGLDEISVNDLRLLDIASSLKTPTMSEMARHAHLTNGTITSAIKKLERKGYAKRERDHQDKRIFRVRLTAKGHRAVACRGHFFHEMINAICGDKDVINNDVLIATLNHLTAFFEKVKDNIG